jgi:hypothetical protein
MPSHDPGRKKKRHSQERRKDTHSAEAFYPVDGPKKNGDSFSTKPPNRHDPILR